MQNFPDQGSNLWPPQWKCRVLTSGPSRKPSSYNWRLGHFDQHLPISPPPQNQASTTLLYFYELGLFRFHMWGKSYNICLFLFDLFYLAKCSQGPSMSHVTWFLSFSQLSNISSYICGIVSRGRRMFQKEEVLHNRKAIRDNILCQTVRRSSEWSSSECGGLGWYYAEIEVDNEHCGHPSMISKIWKIVL